MCIWTSNRYLPCSATKCQSLPRTDPNLWAWDRSWSSSGTLCCIFQSLQCNNANPFNVTAFWTPSYLTILFMRKQHIVPQLYECEQSLPSLVWTMDFHMSGDVPLSRSMPLSCQWILYDLHSVKSIFRLLFYFCLNQLRIDFCITYWILVFFPSAFLLRCSCSILFSSNYRWHCREGSSCWPQFTHLYLLWLKKLDQYKIGLKYIDLYTR